MRRLSRDRWLSGREVLDLSIRLSNCCSGNPTWTAQASVPGCCTVVGMLQGEPPARPGEPDYGRFVYALKDLKRDSGAKAELLILKLLLQRG